ncbi:lantibiotic dehydratase C-terminal domain-containing protein [Spirillospora sp. NPDC049652]
MIPLAPRRPPLPGITWISAHLFHAGDLDRLITGLVAPLMTDLSSQVDGMFFLRYWEGGPHLRLRLRPSHSRHAEQLRRTVEERARDYLAAHPSRRLIGSADYSSFAARQARGERLPAHNPRLYPNDSIEFIDYRPEHRAYGDATCMAAVEAHFSDSSRLALDVLSTCPSHGQRAAICLAAITLSLAACPVRPADFRTVRMPAAVHDLFQQRRDELLRQTHQLWTTGPGPTLATWSDSVRTLRSALIEGGCAPEDARSPLSFLAHAVPSRERPVAEVLLRCTHLFANRLGVGPAVEHRLALLAAHAVATLHESGELP